MKTLILALALASSAGAAEVPLRFVPLANPCRLYDSRDVASNHLIRGLVYQIPMGCGLPLKAQALQVTITVTAPPTDGHLVVWGAPGMEVPPNTSQMAFMKGATSSTTLSVGLWPGVSWSLGGPSNYKAFSFVGMLPKGPEYGGYLFDAVFDVSGYWVE